MMTGGDANLKSLVLLCLEDDPELRPSAIDISERTKRMVEECRKETTYDGMDPISWLAEQASDARHIIQVCYLICEVCHPCIMQTPIAAIKIHHT